jgi:hypothetical protein
MDLFAPLAYWTSNIRKVRIGDRDDGGYVMPEDFENLGGVISIGVGGNTSFDDYFLKRGCPVHQYDGTVASSPSPQAKFIRKNWGARDGAESVSLETMLKNIDTPEKKDLIFKFDVEGAEWEALENVPDDVFGRFRIITCELHDLPGIQFKDDLYARAVKVFAKLGRHHRVVHVHPNNSCDMPLKSGLLIPGLAEFTFLRKDRAEFSPHHEAIPSPLDHPSNPYMDEIFPDMFSFYEGAAAAKNLPAVQPMPPPFVAAATPTPISNVDRRLHPVRGGSTFLRVRDILKTFFKYRFLGGPIIGFHGDLFMNLAACSFAPTVACAIETGTGTGPSTVTMARHFKDVYGCEVDAGSFAGVEAEARTHKNIHPFRLASVEFLTHLTKEKLVDTASSVFFFLDAHSPGNFPLGEELEFIENNFSQPVIMIDDFKVPGKRRFHYDTYGADTIGVDYLCRHLKKTYRMILPTYWLLRTSRHNPLVGWALLCDASRPLPFIVRVLIKLGILSQRIEVPTMQSVDNRMAA